MSERLPSAQCPSPEVPAAFVEGTLDGQLKNEFILHLATCNTCLDEVGAGARLYREESSPRGSWKFARPMWLAAAAVIVAFLGWAGLQTFRQQRASSLLQALVASAPREYRLVEPRLTRFSWAKLDSKRSQRGATLPRNDNAYLKLVGAVGDVLTKAERDPSAEAAHAAGVAKLLLREPAAAVQWLELAASRKPDDAAILTDLAAAQLDRAQRGRPSDLPLALATADRALQLDPTLPEAAFNRALILESMGLREAAIAAWRTYVDRETDAAWRQEGEERLQRLTPTAPQGAFLDRVDALEAAAAAKDTATVLRIVDADRQGARTWYEVEGLGQWAEAVPVHEALARRKLDTARAVGAALLEKSGDAMVADAVRVIDSAPQARLLIAAAHARYRQGRIVYKAQEDLPRAEKLLLEASRQLDAVGSPMADVARYYAANVIFEQNRIAEAASMLEPLLARNGGGRYGALEAQVRSQLGLCHGYAGQWAASAKALTAARDRFERLGESGYVGSMESKLAEVYEFLGQRDLAWQHRTAAFALLSRQSFGDRFAAAMGGAIRAELHAGRAQSGLALLDVEMQVLANGASKLAIADAMRRRALVHAQLDALADAWADLRKGRAILQTLPDSGLRQRLQAEYLFVEGKLSANSDARAAVRLFTTAIDFAKAAGHRLVMPDAWLARARAQRALGQRVAASEDLTAATAELEMQRAAATDGLLRERLFDQGIAVFEEAIDLAVDGGDIGRAFAYADRMRGRAFLPSAAASAPFPLESIRSTLAPNQTLIELTLVGESVVVFTLDRDSLRAHRIPIDRRALHSRVVALRDAMENRTADESTLRRDAAELYRLLLESACPKAGEAEELIVVADRWLQLVPWAAVRDGYDRWLVESFAVTIGSSAETWALATARSRARIPSPRLLAVTGVGGTDSETLRWARREIRDAASIYREHRLLEDVKAAEFQSEAALAEVIHYAGHGSAVTDADAALLLSSSGRDANELKPSSIATWNLTRTRLVLLSACDTARGDALRVEGVSSLARAFLAAGAATVIGALWPIEDDQSAALATEFHRALRGHGDVSRALRDAQLFMLRHPRPEWRHPAAWSGVQLTGASSLL